MMDIKFSDFEDNDRGRQLAEMTKADYWEAQADMWHQNYKEAADEIEGLQDELKFINEVRQSTLQSLFVAKKEIERLREALRTICDGPRDVEKSYVELFAEVKIETRAALKGNG